MARLACGWLCAVLPVLGGCASTTHYVRIAEGLTSPTLAEGIRVAPRMFAAPQLADACQNPRAVARLETRSDVLELQVGQRFPLSSLSIVAVNAANLSMPDVPIAIEAEDRDPPILQLRSDDPELDEGRIYPLDSGRFLMRIRTLCGTAPAEITIVGRVER